MLRFEESAFLVLRLINWSEMRGKEKEKVRLFLLISHRTSGFARSAMLQLPILAVAITRDNATWNGTRRHYSSTNYSAF